LPYFCFTSKRYFAILELMAKSFPVGTILKHTVGGVPPTLIYIYGLLDELDGIIRYVGRTHAPLARLRTHIGEKYDGSLKCRWVQRMREDGRLPQMKILAVAKTVKTAHKLERQFIQQIQNDHGTLLNSK
jgi:hypothetical protein